MTREEEICNAIKDSGICGYKYDDLLTNNEYSGGDIQSAFIEGAEWADNHPINVWHDACEEPKNGQHVLAIDYNGEPRSGIYKSINGGIFDFKYINGIFLSDELVFVWDLVIRWAYIDDLLPKGCNIIENP